MASVRKASELKSLDELKLSKRTQNSVKDIPLEELVLLARTQSLHVKDMWKVCYDELYAAVDAAGFIRHDFDLRGFGVAIIYRCVRPEPEGLTGRPYGHLWDFESNEAYEQYNNLSQAQLDAANQLLDELGDKEKIVLQLRFGLADGREWTLKDVASILRLNGYVNDDEYSLFEYESYGDDEYSEPVTDEYVRRVENRALRKLRHPSRRSKLEAILM